MVPAGLFLRVTKEIAQVRDLADSVILDILDFQQDPAGLWVTVLCGPEGRSVDQVVTDESATNRELRHVNRACSAVAAPFTIPDETGSDAKNKCRSFTPLRLVQDDTETEEFSAGV
jgi:hypothetical protein